MMIKKIVLLIIPALSLSCEKREEIRGAEELSQLVKPFHITLERAMPEKDLQSVLDLYEEDGMYLPLSGSILKGKDKIKLGYENTFRNNVIKFDMRTIELSGDDQFIHEVGIIDATFLRDTLEIQGSFKYLNIYQKQRGGSYKIHRGIYNVNQN